MYVSLYLKQDAKKELEKVLVDNTLDLYLGIMGKIDQETEIGIAALK